MKTCFFCLKEVALGDFDLHIQLCSPQFLTVAKPADVAYSGETQTVTTCQQCGQQVPEDHLRYHMSNKHIKRWTRCVLCFSLLEADQIKTHNCARAPTEACPHCSAQFNTVHIQSHISGCQHSKITRIREEVLGICESCGVQCDLQVHQCRDTRGRRPRDALQNPELLFPCEMCGKQLLVSDMQKHLDQCHKERE